MTSQGNGLAVAGLVLGIIAIPCFFLSIFDIPIAVLSIIFGAVGISKAKKIGGKGKGMATAGLICGVIGLIACIAYTLFVFMVVSKDIEHHRYRGFDSMVVPSPSEPSQPITYSIG